MPKGLSVEIKAALDKTRITGLFYLLDITFPSGTTIYVGERGVTYNGHAYLPAIKSISGLPYVLSGPDSITITFVNVDQYFTELDLAESFLSAQVIIYEYLSSISTAYLKWRGWADELTDITAISATLPVYAGFSNLKLEVPRRLYTLNCPWFFGNIWAGCTTTNFEGCECPYQAVSTIGFVSELSENIDGGTDPITFDTTGLPASQEWGIDDEIQIDNEVLRIRSVSTNTILCERAKYGTTIAAHTAGAAIKFYECHYTVAACKRRGMYGNNSSDANRNYYGGFPIITVLSDRVRMIPKYGYSQAGDIMATGNTSFYGEPLPLFYGRSVFKDAKIPIASVIGKASDEEDWLAVVILVGEGLLATNPYNDSQAVPQQAYAVANDGLERIFVNGVRRHDARPEGLECSNGWYCAVEPNISHLSTFATEHLSFQGTAWIVLQIKQGNNADSADSVVDGLTAELEIKYGRCVRVYSTPTAYTFKPTTDPADVLLDIETSRRSGGGMDYSHFDIQSFIDARDHNLEFVSSVINGTSVPRWTFNGAIVGKKPLADHERDICLGMYCLPPFLGADGKYKIKPLKAESTAGVSVFSSTATILGYRNILMNNNGISSLKKTRRPLLKVPNEIKITFVNSTPFTGEAQIRYAGIYNYTKTQIVLADREFQRRIGKVTGVDSRRINSKEIELPGVSSVDEAARIGTLILRAGEFAEGGTQNNLTVEFYTFYRGSADLELGDIIQVEDPLLDPVNEAYFRVIHLEDEQLETSDGGLLFKRLIRATIHDNDMYDDTAFTCTDLTRLPSVPSMKSEPPAISDFDITEWGSVDKYGTTKAALTITFTEPGDHFGNVDGAHSLGATELDVTDMDDETLYGFVGDKVYIEGHSTIYRLTAGVEFVDGAATLKLDPALEAAVSDNADVKISVCLERGSFKSVVLMRSTVDDNGDPVGDWHFITEITKSNTTVYHDVAQHLECFAAISKSVSGFVPDVDTKDSLDYYKYPRVNLVPDGSADSGVPSGASSLLIIVNAQNATVQRNSMSFQLNRYTANYDSIRELYISMSTSLPAYGPYKAQRDAFSSNIIDSGIGLAITAGSLSVTLGSDPGSVIGKMLVIHTSNTDECLDWQPIAQQDGASLTLLAPFNRTGSFYWDIIEPWVGSGDNLYDQIFKMPDDLKGKSLFDSVWKTNPVPLVEGQLYATGYARNVFGAPELYEVSPLTSNTIVIGETLITVLTAFSEYFTDDLLDRWILLGAYGAVEYTGYTSVIVTNTFVIQHQTYFSYTPTDKYAIAFTARRLYTVDALHTLMLSLKCYSSSLTYLGEVIVMNIDMGSGWTQGSWETPEVYVSGTGTGGAGTSGDPYKLPIGTEYIVPQIWVQYPAGLGGDNVTELAALTAVIV
jgi:hypothetical protein